MKGSVLLLFLPLSSSFRPPCVPQLYTHASSTRVSPKYSPPCLSSSPLDSAPASPPSSANAPFNATAAGETISKITRLARPYFSTRPGVLNLGIVLGLCFLSSFISVQFSYINRDLFTALSAKDVTQFQFVLKKFAVAISLAVPVSVIYRYKKERLR